jgi:CubicO group peptidase (beta-lactamase class C family)
MNTQATKPIALDSLINVFRNKPPDFIPGLLYNYSNSGYILLGYIIQKVSGKPYEQMVHEVIFKRAGMQHSGFDFKGLKDPNRSVGYFVLDTDIVPSGLVDSSVSYAAGAIYSTTGDLYKWGQALKTNRIVLQTSLEKAYTPYKNGYGYGWAIDSVDKKRIIKHNGGIFGFTSDMARVPADDLVIILLCNKSAELEPMTRDLGNIVYGKPYKVPALRQEITLPAATLQHYPGVYSLTQQFKITITLEDGKLKAQATAQSKFELFAEREDFFFLKVVDAQVEFIKGADGKVVKLILHQNGIKQEGQKQ